MNSPSIPGGGASSRPSFEKLKLPLLGSEASSGLKGRVWEPLPMGGTLCLLGLLNLLIRPLSVSHVGPLATAAEGTVCSCVSSNRPRARLKSQLVSRYLLKELPNTLSCLIVLQGGRDYTACLLKKLPHTLSCLAVPPGDGTAQHTTPRTAQHIDLPNSPPWTAHQATPPPDIPSCPPPGGAAAWQVLYLPPSPG